MAHISLVLKSSVLLPEASFGIAVACVCVCVCASVCVSKSAVTFDVKLNLQFITSL